MIFGYIKYEVEPSTTNPMGIVHRPEVILRVIGDKSDELIMALVDIGADESVLPMSIADTIGVVPDESMLIVAGGVGGHPIELLPASVEFEIASDSDSCRWKAVVGFARFENTRDECAVLGHVGALEFFTAIFNGESNQLTLHPNGTFPNPKAGEKDA